MSQNCIPPLSASIAIATAGRPRELADTVRHLNAMIGDSHPLLICPASPADLCGIGAGHAYKAVTGPRGLCHQRNALMSAATSDILIFLDDDFLPADDFVTEAERLFASDPTIVAATGTVLADGILNAGIEYEDGRRIIGSLGVNDGGAPIDTFNAYGCNMIVRMAPVREQALRFDETLPLYGWLEDVDFCRQLAPYGRIVKSPRLRGVHLGTKRAGRSPGIRLGYSQIANPAYLARKGSIPWSRALRHISRNVAANAVRSAGPEPWVDRRGRLKGNLKAARDALAGKLHPQRVLNLE